MIATCSAVMDALAGFGAGVLVVIVFAATAWLWAGWVMRR